MGKLKDKETIDLFTDKCYYCGTVNKNKWVTDNGDIFEYSGIDRVNNEIGYIKANVVSCCKMCNSMKLIHTDNEFINHCVRVAKHCGGVYEQNS